MSARTPTVKQYRLLRILADGSALIVGRASDVKPLLHHGWVTSREDYCWVRITADGLRALALAVERYGLPDIAGRAAGSGGNP